jgi:hypothetical protein
MKNLFVLLMFLSTSVFAQVLPANAPERQQLIAMGAEILLEEKGDVSTFFKLGGDSFFINKSQERTAIGRNFSRKTSLNKDEELEIHKLVNKFNREQVIQFVLFERSLQTNAFTFGNYDPKVFARIVLALSKVESVFEANPSIYKLVNN